MKNWILSSVMAFALTLSSGYAAEGDGGDVGQGASDSSDSATNWKGVALAGGAIAVAAVALVLVANHHGHHHGHSH